MIIRKNTTLIILLFLFFAGYSNPLNVDSLQNVANSSVDFSEKIEIYIQISTELINTDLDSAMLYAEKANVLIETFKSDSAKAEVFLNLGNVNQARGNFALSLDYLFRAQRLLEDIIRTKKHNTFQYQKQLIEVLSSIGATYFYQGVHEKALEHYELALDYYEDIRREAPHLHSPIDKSKLFNNLAGVYIRIEEYNRALEYYNTALDLIDDDTESRLGSSLYNNLGICYME